MSAARQTFTRPEGGFMVIRRTVRIGVYVATMGLTAQLAATCAWGQQLYIYPQRGQSFDQEAVDKAECQRWATQQTGYNPGAPAPPPPPGHGRAASSALRPNPWASILRGSGRSRPGFRTPPRC